MSTTTKLLTILLAVVGVLDIPGWAKAVIMICLSIIILVAIVGNARVHNLLLRSRGSYEGKLR